MATVTERGRERQWLSLRAREAIEGYLFMAPAVIGFALFTLFPMLASLALSFTEYDLLSAPEWIGLENYRRMVTDPFFWQSLRVTTTYAAIGLPLGLIFALGVAMLMNQDVPGITL